MFPDDMRPDRCGVRLIMLYQSKKPSEAMKPDFSFLLSSKNISSKDWKDIPVWYSTSPMGVHKIGEIVKTS